MPVYCNVSPTYTPSPLFFFLFGCLHQEWDSPIRSNRQTTGNWRPVWQGNKKKEEKNPTQPTFLAFFIPHPSQFSPNIYPPCLLLRISPVVSQWRNLLSLCGRAGHRLSFSFFTFFFFFFLILGSISLSPWHFAFEIYNICREFGILYL